jgi:alkaline phosphatase D
VPLDQSNGSEAAQAAGLDALNDYVQARLTPAPLRTSEQEALTDPASNPLRGYNLDAWDGYLAARETVLATSARLGKRLVALAGDTHNAWHLDLTLKGLTDPTLADVKVGEEFACSSVTSPGLEAFVGLRPSLVKAIFEGVADDVHWMDPSRRGYLKMRFTASEARGEWYFVNTVTERSYTVELGHSATYTG